MSGAAILVRGPFPQYITKGTGSSRTIESEMMRSIEAASDGCSRLNAHVLKDRSTGVARTAHRSSRPDCRFGDSSVLAQLCISESPDSGRAAHHWFRRGHKRNAFVNIYKP